MNEFLIFSGSNLVSLFLGVFLTYFIMNRSRQIDLDVMNNLHQLAIDRTTVKHQENQTWRRNDEVEAGLENNASLG